MTDDHEIDEYIDEMYFRELMEGEDNHGRRKGVGSWSELNPVMQDVYESGFEILRGDMMHNPTFKHGTLYAYARLNCRCDECRATWREYIRAYRKRL